MAARRSDRAIVVGAGVGGLAAAVALAAEGVDVLVCETAPTPGGKMRQLHVDGAAIDAGPTVLTMRWVFDELFRRAGVSLDDHLALTPLDVLARHAWSDGSRLDLFADERRSADAIGALAGAGEAEGYRRFRRDSQRIFETLDAPFLRAQQPSVLDLVRRVGFTGLGALAGIQSHRTLWSELGRYFRDPRLRQLFGRYATYSGSSPFLAPATLMLIAHVERLGVWSVAGGMGALASALARLAEAKGARLRYGTPVERILVAGGRTSGVRLADGEEIAADAVVFNGDAQALADGLLGEDAAPAARALPRSKRSLSALTVAMRADVSGFPLARHTVFFSDDGASEFGDLFSRRRLPERPTVYICAQDRTDGDPAAPGPERLFMIVNAPADGDVRAFDDLETGPCLDRSFGLMERCGLRVSRTAANHVVTTPRDFQALFPATGGALYGQASHGWKASFDRAKAVRTIPGLYLAGGSAHPGAGAPMAALSGQLTAERVLAGLSSTAKSRPAATRGGMSTRSATMGSTASRSSP